MVKKAKIFKPGDYVFAKVKGYPAWPAKVVQINGKKYNIYFFGTGETGNLPANDLFDYFEHKQQFSAKVIKRRDYNEGLVQIEEEVIENGITNNSSTGETPNTTMEAEEAQTPIAETTVGDNNTSIEEVKETAEISVAEEVTEDVDMAPTEHAAEESANDNIIQDDDAELANDTSAEVEEAVEATAPESPPKDPTSTPTGRGKRAAATPKAQNIAKTPRRSVKQEIMSPKSEPKTPVPESTSRSGRKIKPKRYLDEETEENASVPAGGKRAKLAGSPPEENIAIPVVATPTHAKVLNKKAQNGDSKKTRFYTESELENIQEPINQNDESGSQKDNILIAQLPSGKHIGIKLFKDRPETFASPAVRLQWENTTAKNAIKMKQQLESGQIKPESISTLLETELNLSEEEVTALRRERELDIQRNRLSFLRVESKLIVLENQIRTSLAFAAADVDLCIDQLDQIASLELMPLMLLKHPVLVETVKRCRRYVGNRSHWNLTPEQDTDFSVKAHRIRKRAEHCCNMFKLLFTLHEGKSFWETFAEQVLLFKKATKNLTELELVELVEMPADMSKPSAFTMKAAMDAMAAEEETENLEGFPDKSGDKTKSMKKSAEVTSKPPQKDKVK